MRTMEPSWIENREHGKSIRDTKQIFDNWEKDKREISEDDEA